jgi:hypothetical protein
VIRTGPGRAASAERWDVDETAGLFQRVSSTPLL